MSGSPESLENVVFGGESAETASLTQEDLSAKAKVEALAQTLKNTDVEWGFKDKDNWYIAFD